MTLSTNWYVKRVTQTSAEAATVVAMKPYSETWHYVYQRSEELSASIFRIDVCLNDVSSFCKVLAYLVPSGPRRPICSRKGDFFFSRHFEDVWGSSGEEGAGSWSKRCNRNFLSDAEQAQKNTGLFVLAEWSIPILVNY